MASSLVTMREPGDVFREVLDYSARLPAGATITGASVIVPAGWSASSAFTTTTHTMTITVDAGASLQTEAVVTSRVTLSSGGHIDSSLLVQVYRVPTIPLEASVKDPDDDGYVLTVDWASHLLSGDTIASVTFVGSGVSASSPTHNDTSASCVLSGGTSGAVADVAHTVTTAAGERLSVRARVPVR